MDYIWGDKTSTPYPFPDETEPFLISPRNNKTLDFGILLQGDNKTIDLDIQGKNLTETLNLYWKTGGENSGLSLSQESVTANEAINGKTIHICYMPQTSGTGIDTLVIKGGGLTDSVIVKVSRDATEDFMQSRLQKRLLHNYIAMDSPPGKQQATGSIFIQETNRPEI